jgi:hypothetical protein
MKKKRDVNFKIKKSNRYHRNTNYEYENFKYRNSKFIDPSLS